jgi:DNA-binding IclR family transcriptional regulator
MDKSFAKGLALLEALVRGGRLMGVTELARELRMQKSNAHRLLQTLLALGFARQDPGTGRYGASVKVWELGTLVLSRLEIRDIAEPWLAALGRRCGETVNLSIRDGAHVLFIDRLEQGQPSRAGYIGVRAPAHALATGKVLLAFASPEVQERALERLQAFTRKTITDSQAMRKELTLIRERGYAMNRGEWRELVNSIAVPIRDAKTEVIAAIGITGPVERMGTSRLRELLPDLRETAHLIAHRLGASPDSGAGSAMGGGTSLRQPSTRPLRRKASAPRPTSTQ